MNRNSSATHRFTQSIRQLALHAANTGRLKRFIQRACPAGKTPIFIVLTPDVVHMAPLAVVIRSAVFQPMFLLNNVCADDQNWLKTMIHDVPMFNLTVSFTRNRQSLLSHGAIIQYLLMINQTAFCIQDSDCFVTDGSFFNGLKLDLAQHYVAGPFSRIVGQPARQMPYTYYLYLNAPFFRRLHCQYGLRADSMREVPPKLTGLMHDAGFPKGCYVDPGQGYYDTLEVFWIVAHGLGLKFNVVPGDGKTVFHVGGSSYLSKVMSDVTTWDYWALNLHYFNLRLLSFSQCKRFVTRFAPLFKHYRDANNLLAQYPDYRKGRKYEEVCRIIETLNAEQLYT